MDDTPIVAHVDKANSLFALGVSLFLCLTGRRKRHLIREVVDLNDDCLKERRNDTLKGGGLDSLCCGCAQQRKVEGFNIVCCVPLGDICAQTT